MNIRYLATVDGPKWTRSDAPQRPTGSKGGVGERRETFWRPRDLVHILYATAAVEGVFTAMIKNTTRSCPLYLTTFTAKATPALALHPRSSRSHFRGRPPE